MNKYLKVIPFYFTSPHKEVYEEANSSLKISLKYNEDLINRVCKRHPLIPKQDIIIVLTKSMEVMRDILIQGDIINFSKLFTDTKLYFQKSERFGKLRTLVKVRMVSPHSISNKNV